ncbi:MAG: azurin, partial [Mariniblastus sp.]
MKPFALCCAARGSAFLAFCTLSVAISASNAEAQSEFEFKSGDNICFIGNTLADRMQHYPWLETYLTHANPNKTLTFRNLGFAADEIKTRPRSANFGTPDQWLAKCNATVIFCFFGYNEALRGEDGLSQFESDLASSIDQMLGQKYNGKTAPRLVFFSPIAHENLN